MIKYKCLMICLIKNIIHMSYRIKKIQKCTYQRQVSLGVILNDTI